ncbi:hypothetical protein UlMin_004154 [Ulmus minor]
MGKQRLSSMFTSSVFKKTRDEKVGGLSCDSIVGDVIAEFAPDEADRERERRRRQENTVIQTCVVACYGLAFSGGFGSSMVAMDERTYNLIGADYPGNRAEDVKNPRLGWMTGFLFVVSFLGLFSLVPLRKVMVMDYKLTYPSGTATAMLINSFHTDSGAELAGKQVHCLGKYLSISLVWSCFKWFFSGVGDSCGFDNFPTLGLTLFKNSFYFDFSPTYIGCGLICPHIVNCSVLLGAIISWGFLWPFISGYAGDWYPADLGSNDFKGLYGYKVFIAIALILGDGLYNLIKIIAITSREMCNRGTKQTNLPDLTEALGRRSLHMIFLGCSKHQNPSWNLYFSILTLISISSLFCF